MDTSSDIYIRSANSGVIRQGEILSNVVQFCVADETLTLESLRGQNAQYDVIRRDHPFAIVVSQDCDLESDWRSAVLLGSNPDLNEKEKRQAAANLMSGILFCEVTFATDLKGTNAIDSDLWRRIKQGYFPRYHLLEQVPEQFDLDNQDISALGIDFKKYFTIPPRQLYHCINIGVTKRRCYMQSPYFEQVSDRFAHYLGRIGLPRDHQV